MAQEVVGIKVQVEGGDSVGSLKKQLKEAQQDVQVLSDKFGATSEQAVAAAKKAAELKDRIGDAKALTDAFNPDRKFQAFASALQGVVGGISAFQGAMGLLGVKNEEVEKTLLRVNAAMALSQGINSVLEARDSFKNLGAVIQSTAIFQKANNAATTVAIALQKAFGVATIGTGRAFTILKGAIAATGIGLLVVGLTTLISKIGDWLNTTEKAAEAQKKLAEKNDLVNASIQNQIDKLTALGGKEKEILELKKQQIENELNVIRASVKQKDGFTQEELKRFRDLKAEKEILDINEANRIKKLNEDAAKEQEKKDKEASDKQIQRNNERITANKDAEEQLRKARQDAELNNIEDENKKAIRKAEIDFENRKLEIESLKANETLKTKLLTEAQKERDQTIAKLKEDAAQAEITKIIEQFDRQAAADKAEEERRKAQQQKEFDDIFERLDRENEAERKAAEANKQIAEEEAKFRKQQISETGDALGKLGEIVGQQTAAGKALGIAQALINTYQGATEALKQKSTLPSPFDFAAKAINVAAIIASGLKAVKAITAVKVPGGGGGVTTPVTSITGGGAAPIAPETPGATLTQLDQSTINRLGSATNRSYVLESDVTNSQERIRRINRAARLN